MIPESACRRLFILPDNGPLITDIHEMSAGPLSGALLYSILHRASGKKNGPSSDVKNRRIQAT
jgi:hypothetical protein